MSLPRTNIDLRAYVPVAAALFAAAVTMWAPQAFNDGDTWWHVAAGRWMIEHLQIPHTDPFSYTRPGVAWQTHEWLSEILMAGAFRIAGWSGVLALFGLFTGAAAYLMSRRVTKSLGGVTVLVVLALAFACMGPSLLLRPHLLMLPVLTTWLMELLAARDANRPPHLAWALLMIPWANLHGSFVFGYLLAAAFALEALLAANTWPERIDVVRGWGLFGLASLAAALITPHGIDGLIFPFQVMTMTTLNGINEWQASNFTRITAFELAIIATLFIGLGRGVKMGMVRLLTLLLLTHMALQHVRHVIVLALVAPMLLAEPIAIALAQRPLLGAPPRRALAATLILGFVLLGVRIALPMHRADNVSSPISAMAAVPAELRARPVFNEYSFGGYLIFERVKVYIDGRADMYGDDFFRGYLNAIRAGNTSLDRELKQRDIAWTILMRTNPDIAILDARPGWRRLITTERAIVHVRNDALPQDAPPASALPSRGSSAPPSTTR